MSCKKCLQNCIFCRRPVISSDGAVFTRAIKYFKTNTIFCLLVSNRPQCNLGKISSLLPCSCNNLARGSLTQSPFPTYTYNKKGNVKIWERKRAAAKCGFNGRPRGLLNCHHTLLLILVPGPWWRDKVYAGANRPIFFRTCRFLRRA